MNMKDSLICSETNFIPQTLIFDDFLPIFLIHFHIVQALYHKAERKLVSAQSLTMQKLSSLPLNIVSA